MSTVLGLPRVQDIQPKLPAISTLLIYICHDYLGDITTSNLRDFDLNQALFNNDCDGRGMEVKSLLNGVMGQRIFSFTLKTVIRWSMLQIISLDQLGPDIS